MGERCMGIVTDSKSPEESKDPETCNIFALHKLFLKDEELEALQKRYIDGGLGYKESKEMLLTEIIEHISPLREKRKEFENNPEIVRNILKNGKEKAKEIVEKKMELVRTNIGVNI
jgi:tryptophanyl-tRNA synthetase